MPYPKSISSVLGFLESIFTNRSDRGSGNSLVDRSLLPVPVLPDHPGYVELYWKAWEIAIGNIRRNDAMPQPVYIDEAFSDRLIWIWDTCFMLHFFKYAHRAFNAVCSLDNFYIPLLNGLDAPVLIRHADNPPLMAWSESAFFSLSGDTHRLQHILTEERYLQRYFEYVESFRRGSRVPGAEAKVKARRTELGYLWGPLASGMDNSPRGKGKQILYLDLACQQALAAHSTADLLERIGEAEEAEAYRRKHSELARMVNEHYWDDAVGLYFDIESTPPHAVTGKRTIASFWPMLAGIPDADRVERMIRHLQDPMGFGGEFPLPSLARDEPEYRRDGRYWRGGIWAPSVYMVVKGLERYGHFDLARELAGKFLRQVDAAYRKINPATIWECYRPEAALPADTVLPGRRCRPDFCGWSALAPVSLLIENVIGIRSIDAGRRSIHWEIGGSESKGVRNLYMGSVCTDLEYGEGKILVRSDGAYTLVVNGRACNIVPGQQVQDLM